MLTFRIAAAAALYRRNWVHYSLLIIGLAVAVATVAATNRLATYLRDATDYSDLVSRPVMSVGEVYGDTGFAPIRLARAHQVARTEGITASVVYSNRRVRLSHRQLTRQINLGLISASAFDVFNVTAVRGRPFSGEERGVAVISEHIWRHALGGDRSVLGRRIRLDDRSFTVVGVMPNKLRRFPAAVQDRLIDRTDIWIPVDDMDGIVVPDGFPVELRDRLPIFRQFVMTERGIESAVLDERANARLASYDRTVGRSGPRVRSTQGLTARPAASALARRLLTGFQIGSIGVLLATLASTALFLLGQVTARGKELAIQRSLGGTATQRGAGLAFELIPVLMVVGVATLPLVQAIGYALSSLLPDFAGALGGNGRWSSWAAPSLHVLPALVLAYLFMVAVQTGSMLAQRGPSAGQVVGDHPASRHLQIGLIVTQVVIATVTSVIGIEELTRAMRAVQADWGLPGANLQIVRSGVTGDVERFTMPSRPNAAQWRGWLRRVRDRAAVDAAALVESAPGASPSNVQQVRVRAQGSERHFSVVVNHVSQGFHGTAQMNVLSGTRDRIGERGTVVVNQAFVDAYGQAGGFRAGMRLVGEGMPEELRGRRAVALVSGLKYVQPLEPMRAQAFVPGLRPMAQPSIIVRGAVSASHLVGLVKDFYKSTGADLTVTEVASLNSLTRQRMRRQFGLAGLSASVAAAVLILAFLGIYGVLYKRVEQRSRELALYRALGATRLRIARSVSAGTLVAQAVGLAVAVAVWVLMASLEMTRSEDSANVGALAAAMLVVTGTAFISVASACRRISRDPGLVLKQE